MDQQKNINKNINLFITITFAILIIYYIWVRWIRRKKGKEAGIDQNTLNFYSRHNKGEKIVRILTSTNVFDISFIESLLRHHNIPYLLFNDHICSLRPGTFVKDFNNAFIHILEKDAIDTKKIIEYYFKNKVVSKTKLSYIRNIIECFGFGWVVPYAGYSGNSTLFDLPIKNKDLIYCMECKKPFLIAKRYKKTNLCEECFKKDINK